jgi:ankyrin repeat protein
VVKVLLENGADVNAQGWRYGNALQAAAAARGNTEVVKVLLENGADVNAQGGLYGNALQAAQLKGNTNVVEILLEKRAATTEEPTYNYPPSRSSEFSRDSWPLESEQKTANASTIHTSVDAGGQGKEQDLADTESVYTSDVPGSLAYMQELVASFFKSSELPDAESLDRVCAILPDLLRGFALRIGGENQVSIHFEVMKFIHMKRT